MDHPPAKRPETFRAWVDLAVEQLRRSASIRKRRLPSWDRVLVIEEENGERTGPGVSLDEFESRFKQVLRRTTRGWINLHVDPIEAGVFLLVVEYISRNDQSAVRVPPEKISVNISGPPIVWFETLPGQKRTG